MKKISCTILIVLALCVVLTPSGRTTTVDERTVTGAARATFAQGAILGNCVVKTMELGTGVFVESDGSASGIYSAVLTGKSLLGQPLQITIEGKVLQGDVLPGGQALFNGLATVNLGNGTPSLVGVPFSVTTTDDSVRLSLLSVTLPAQVTSGVINIE